MSLVLCLAFKFKTILVLEAKPTGKYKIIVIIMQILQKNDTITVAMETAQIHSKLLCSCDFDVFFSSSSNMVIKHIPQINLYRCVTSGHLPCPQTLAHP